MRAICRSWLALISLLLAAAPAAALQIATPLGGSGWGSWSAVELTAIEFNDDDWAAFIEAESFELFPPPFGALETDFVSVESLLTQVWERR